MELHLNPLRTKTIGVLEFEAESPFHVGAGGEDVRRGLLRLQTEELIVPSSTWKGAFRSLSEQLAKSISFDGIDGIATLSYSEGPAGISYRGSTEDLRAEFEKFTLVFMDALRGEQTQVIPHSHAELVALVRELGYTNDDVKEVVKSGLKAEGGLAFNIVEEYIALHCPIGKLYGNRVMAGKVRFIDSVLKGRGEIRPGVGIDRKSGKARGKTLYFLETAIRGLNMKAIFVADNLHPGENDSTIFTSTIKAVAKFGLSIGTRKSAGLGNLNLSKASFYIIDLNEDAKRDHPLIGNPFRLEPKDLSEFLRWLEG